MRFRFSLFTLVVLLTIAALVVGFAANRARTIQANQKTIDELRAFQIFAKFEDGTVPQKGRSDGFFNWLRVKRIDRADNIISDKAIAQIADLRDLRFVQINGPVTNAGLANLKKLRELEELTIYSPNVTNEGLAHVSHLENLRRLDLAFSQLTDDSLSHIAHLPSLKDLSLANTDIADKAMIDIAQIPNLESLSLEGTKVSDAGMRDIGKSPCLITLNIQKTEIGNAGLGHLSELKSLETVNIANTRATYGGLGRLLFDSLGRDVLEAGFVTSSEKYASAPYKYSEPDRLSISLVGPQYDDVAFGYLIRGAPNVNSLTLDSTSISDDGIRVLSELKELELLIVKDMQQLTEIRLPAGLERLTFCNQGKSPLPSLSNLEQLKTFNCECTDEGNKALWYEGEGLEQALDAAQASPKFSKLEISYAKLGKDHFELIGKCKQMESLSLLGTTLTDEELALICDLPNLEYLQLNGEHLTDEGIGHLAKLANLRELWVSDCSNLTATACSKTFVQLGKLQELSISNSGMPRAELAKIQNALPNCKFWGN